MSTIPASPQQQPQTTDAMHSQYWDNLGKDRTPPPGYGPPYTPQPWPLARPPRKSMSQGRIAVLAVAAALLVLLAIGLGTWAMNSTSSVGKDSVKITSCTTGGEIVGAQAGVEVVNNDSVQHSYMITVAFTDASQSTQYATGTAYINDLAPGQTGQATATSFSSTGGIAGCKVAHATRM